MGAGLVGLTISSPRVATETGKTSLFATAAKRKATSRRTNLRTHRRNGSHNAECTEGLDVPGVPASSSVEEDEETCRSSRNKDVRLMNRRQAMRRTSFALGATVLPSMQGFQFYEAFAAIDEPGDHLDEWVLSVGLSTLTVRSDGTMDLRGNNGSTSPQTLNVILPRSAGNTKASLSPARKTPPGALLSLQWPGGTTLVVWDSGDEAGDMSRRLFSWAAGVGEGFLLELSVPSDVDDVNGNTEQAEINVDLQTGGRWYGGAHLLRQLWPLDRAQWELGPMYPFDHGPNGLGSVVGAHWVSSRGTFVAVDPGTPMLHVGLNASTQQRPRDDPRFFGVGIQHLTQEALPYEDGVASRNRNASERGDGKLRIQARRTWQDGHVLHPWQAIGTPESEREQRRAFNEGENDEVTYAGKQPYTDVLDDPCVLRIAIAATSDVRAATLSALKPLQSPQLPPLAVVFNRPTWTTWATSHADVTQADVLALGKAVIDNGYRPGVLVRNFISQIPIVLFAHTKTDTFLLQSGNR
jgi:hypothetical protein